MVPVALGAAAVTTTASGDGTAAEGGNAPAARAQARGTDRAEAGDRSSRAPSDRGSSDRAPSDRSSQQAPGRDGVPADPAQPVTGGPEGSLAGAAGSASSSPGREQGPAEQARGGLERAASARHEQYRGPVDRTAGLPERTAVDPAEVLSEATAPGGCVPEYGADGQCLPAVPPSLVQHVQDMEQAGLDPSTMPHHWSCAELRTVFPEGITVRQQGKDPQELDGNGDGTACGPGD
ncbi:hypothetical protein AUQ48_14475 [Kocuria flava]|uniref:Excalibur calcium-binding domain-containing protein n=1 Tax=Kocuria flava TaxID=446860 RepID=A0A2N4T4P0_9MICC|nr:hypothetical protein AUQ48_14475 [Kocuria flava]